MMQSCQIKKGLVLPEENYVDTLEDPAQLAKWFLQGHFYFHSMYLPPDGRELTVVEFCVRQDIDIDDVAFDLPTGFWILSPEEVLTLHPEKPMPFSPLHGTRNSSVFQHSHFESLHREMFPGPRHAYVWKFNPWTGEPRSALAMAKDPQCTSGERQTRENETAEKLARAKLIETELPLLYSPTTGEKDDPVYKTKFTPSAYREMYPKQVWAYNPWTGKKRPLPDVQLDPQCTQESHSPLVKKEYFA
ncbi:MAG: hypothetical protein Q7S87_08620 [Agitococcus sp.]|nr:hypothetical protein [Agitococcus sp.]MDO9177633.1 hypothetical protein [Agitococcus sp.]